MIESTISLADKKQIITEFLQQCNGYSDAMLKKYEQQLTDEQTKKSAPQKIHDWTVYKNFNEYAIKELKGTDLDDWFA
jgi:predicted DNA binding CopG/RHH family protein